MAGMGVISRGFDKLPTWMRVVLMILAVAVCIYGITRDGWTILLKVIFSPDL
jgi:SNF family Na+-dependent transporter